MKAALPPPPAPIPCWLPVGRPWARRKGAEGPSPTASSSWEAHSASLACFLFVCSFFFFFFCVFRVESGRQRGGRQGRGG